MRENHAEEIAYELKRNPINLDRWEDLNVEAWLWEFPGWKEISFSRAEPINIPEPVIFDSVDELIRETDYPYTDVTTWPVMSKRVLAALLSVQEFPHQAIPVEMRDNEQILDRETGEYSSSGLVSHDFVIVQLLEQKNAFDWEKSTYKRNPRRPEVVKVGTLKNLVFERLQSDLPPLFRLSAYPYLLLVSAAAKEALEAIDVKCVKFVPASKVRA